MNELPNLNYIYKLSAGDSTIKSRLVNILLEEFPQDVRSYYENLKKQDLVEASENVHKIKHKIGLLGLEEGYLLSQKHELSLKENSLFYKEDFEIILKKIADFIAEL
jgi:HPt (histidine-containing phosphotransfer) domain-containing protein